MGLNNAFASLSLAALEAAATAAESWKLTAWTGRVTQEPDPLEQINAERQAVRGLQTQAMERAHAAAETRGRAAAEAKGIPYDPEHHENWPTMNDYFIAAHAPDIREQAAQANVSWTPAAISNFAGMELRNLQMRADDLDGTITGEKRDALLAALTGLDAAQREAQHIDDDTVISAFYANIEHRVTFNETTLYNVHFHPADTFNDYVKGRAVSCENITFDKMEAGETVMLGRGEYTNIRFTDISGGKITIEDHARINGMDIRGAHADISIGAGARVSDLKVDQDTRILRFDAAPGAEIATAEFGENTISMASELAGTRWTDVKFNGTSLSGVDLSGATLANVELNDMDRSTLAGLNLNGATLINVRINGEPVRDVEQLKAFGIEAEGAKIETRERGVRLDNLSPELPAPPRPDPAEAKTPIIYEGSLTGADNVSAGYAVANNEMKFTKPPEQEAGIRMPG